MKEDKDGSRQRRRAGRHDRGVGSEPGLYFLGLLFLYALSSPLVGGVGRDAEHIARHIAARRLLDRPKARVSA
jgi:putative flavoprotein involved in K+ transport